MQALFQMLESNKGKGGAVQEDALVAIGTLIEVLGMNFLQYVDVVLPYVYQALNNHAEYQICAAAVGVIGDLSRSLADRLTPYCDQIMSQLLTCLNVSRSSLCTRLPRTRSFVRLSERQIASICQTTNSQYVRRYRSGDRGTFQEVSRTRVKYVESGVSSSRVEERLRHDRLSERFT